MNQSRQRYVLGFTLVETMAALGIFILVLVMALNSWMYIVRMERVNSVQNELDIQVRTTMERLRQDLRLSSLDHIFVYPQGSPTNSAISFPKARDDNGDGLIELDANGKIIWDVTLVYHVWQATPNELRLTTFDPRDNSLTDAQRQSQLESVVLNGNGYATFNGQNARTRALFRNLFTWNVRGRGAQFDLYSPQVVRMRNVDIGTALLGPGNHAFKFTVLGKNALSTGYKLGLDQLVVSPCGIEREAEDQLATATYSGATPIREYMSQGAWGANYQLAFPASGPGASFTLTMENDRWEETNFKGEGALCEDTVVFFDETLSPADFVVSLPGGTSWLASAQTGDTAPNTTSTDALKGFAIRVLIRGGQMADGGALDWDGPLYAVVVRGPWLVTTKRLCIRGAFIAEAASHTSYSPDAAYAGKPLTFYDTGGVLIGSVADIPPGGTVYARLTNETFIIDRSKSYIISFLVDSTPAKCDSRYWVQTNKAGWASTPPGSYIIPPSGSPDLAMTRAAVWSTNSSLQISDRLYAIEAILASPLSGQFTSHIVDTGQAAPQYTQIGWNALKDPGSDLYMRVRTGNMKDMSDALAWASVPLMSAPGSLSGLASKRYVQFQAVVTGSWNTVTHTLNRAKLRDVNIRWNGITKLTDIAGTFTMGPDYGIMEVTVNNKPLIRGMTIDLTIYKDVPGFGGRGSNRLTSTLTTEVEPRNTGK